MNTKYMDFASTEQKIVLKARASFVMQYCEKKGWDPSELSFEQVFEIRDQDEWKKPKF